MSALWSYLLVTICLLHQLTANDINPPVGEALCKKPTIHNVSRLSIDMEYYNKGEEARVQCNPGYYPSSDTIRCDNPPEWTPPTITCIGVTMEDRRVTSSSISVRISCTPQCPHIWRFTVQCCTEPYNDRSCKTSSGKSVTFTDLQPSTEYRIYTALSTDEGQSPGIVESIFIRTKDLDRCKNPDGRILTMYPKKTFYNIGDTVTVKCPTGYRPNPSSVRCVKIGSSIGWNNPPQCIAQCSPPTISNMKSIYVYKKYYNKNEEIRVRCQSGYYPSSSSTMRCENPRSSPEWTPSVTCIAQCSPPTIPNMESISVYKKYYNKNEEIRVQCQSGYYPSSSTMRCDNPRSSPEWTPPTITCIGVTMKDWRVTSSSISGRISCTPQCPHTWRFTVRCCAELYNYRSCKTSSGKSVTFTDLQPSTEYRIDTTLYTYRGQSPGTLEVIYIRTEDSVPGQLEIMKVPSMEDNTIRWRLSEKWGNITGFQMNISAWRDYNVSFAVDESLQFPLNVTEYKIPLQYGTNYTITLRGFTSGGAGEVTTQNIENYIGDPPLHMEKTISDVTLWLHPVLSLNGPIRSYDIIVFGGQEGNLTEECLNFKNTPYNSSWTPILYTAAVLPAEILTRPRTFTLGDNHHYNGFHNAPLISNHNYTVYIRVTSRWNHVEKSSCAFAGFLQKRTDGSFVIVLSLPSFGFIITMLSLKFLVLVGLAVIPLTPWMEMGNPAEKRKKKRTNISTEDVADDKVYEVLEEAENGI